MAHSDQNDNGAGFNLQAPGLPDSVVVGGRYASAMAMHGDIRMCKAGS